MFRHDWKLLLIGLLVVAFLMFLGLQIGKYLAIGQEPINKQYTGYFVKVEALNVPIDITTVPIGTFVLFDKSGSKEIWRENVALGTYTDDVQLEDVIDNWAIPYIEKYERQVALSNLAKTSKIVGQKIGHKQ
mgnify:CR=1 FL=1